MSRPLVAIVSLGVASALSLGVVAPAAARSDALPQGVSAWMTPTGMTPPYAGYYAKYTGTTLTVAFISTVATNCSTGTIANNTGTMTSSVNGTPSVWTLTRSGRKLTVHSVGQVYESTNDYLKYTPKKAAKLLKQGRKGNQTAKKLLAKCGVTG
jgi:hypothetical protein